MRTLSKWEKEVMKDQGNDGPIFCTRAEVEEYKQLMKPQKLGVEAVDMPSSRLPYFKGRPIVCLEL